MERSLDLIRTILLETERNPSPMVPLAVRAPGYAPDQIAYHVPCSMRRAISTRWT